MFHSISKKHKDRTKLVYKFRVWLPVRMALSIQRRCGSVPIVVVEFQMFFTCFCFELDSDLSVAQHCSLVVLTEGHQGLDPIGCR